MVKNKYYDMTLILVTFLALSVLIYLLTGLFQPMQVDKIQSVLLNMDTLQAILISITSIIISMVIVSSLGTLLAYKMMKKQGRLYDVINVIITLPLILPPTVAGLVLLQGFGRNSLLNQYFFGGTAQIPFNFIAIVLAQVYVTLPYFYQITLNAFDEVDNNCIEAARVCGADRAVMLGRILIPISQKSMMAGLFLSALRGLSEFGATIMFAGNMVGKTQTITTRIYQLYQTDIESAFILAGFQLVLFVIPYLMIVRRRQL